MFREIASGWIETESKPTYHGWPTICLLPDGRLLAAASGGRELHVCPFGRVHLYESADGGLSWSAPRILSKGPLDDRDCGITLAGDGSILINYFTSIHFLEGSVNYRPHWAEATRAVNLDMLRHEHGLWMMRSTDNGRTWSEKYRVPCNNVHGPALLLDGSLLWVGRDQASGVGCYNCMGDRIAAFRSTDNGLSWQEISVLPLCAGQSCRDWHEVHTAQMPDGTIITQIRNHSFGYEPVNSFTLQMESHDGGLTWSKGHPVALGYPTHLLRLADGRMLMTYGWRLDPCGIRARLAQSCNSWGPEMKLLETDAGMGEGCGDIGYPSTAQLADGTLITLFYQMHPVVKTCRLRWIKWELD